MHPLFTSHIVADFLLQPARLVAWKKRSVAGIAVHAAIHGLLLAAMIAPARPSVLASIALVAFLHGLIDFAKIKLQLEDGIGTSFLLDQIAHFIVLIITAATLPLANPVWFTESGKGISSLLFFFSFAFAIKNIRKPQTVSPSARTLLILLIFLLFFIPARLLAFSF